MKTPNNHTILLALVAETEERLSWARANLINDGPQEQLIGLKQAKLQLHNLAMKILQHIESPSASITESK